MGEVTPTSGLAKDPNLIRTGGPDRMIEETPLLKRLAFKQTDTHFLTLWADWRDPIKYKTIVELVRRGDGAEIVNESYDVSDDAIKHYTKILKEINA